VADPRRRAAALILRRDSGVVVAPRLVQYGRGSPVYPCVPKGMPADRTAPGTARSTITVPAPVLEGLKRLAEQNDRSIVDEVRGAVQFWKYVHECVAGGGAVMVERPDGTKYELVLDLVL
jgi:hypothetical protein